MNKIDVLWVSRHEDVLARGYADMGMLEAIFEREIWTPPEALEFNHHLVADEWPVIDGAIVVVPARHHADDVDWLLEKLDKLSWSLVILCGDEEWVFPWARIRETETRRVWTMQSIPGQSELSGALPCGWYPLTREYLKSAGYRKRTLDWFFAGQVTHSRREACARVLEQLPNGEFYPTDGYLKEVIARPQYFERMALAKIVPSPSGPCHVDTARTFEALEAGCIPVCDLMSASGSSFNYWELLFGKDNLIPVMEDWEDLKEIIRPVNLNWMAVANQLYAMWQQFKRKTTLALDSQVRSLAHADRTSLDPNDLITVIITTSPIPSHPSTEIIDITIESIREQLPRAQIIIAADGVRMEDQSLYSNYQQYLHKLLWKTNFEYTNIVPVVLDEWKHQAHSVKAAIELVDTPLVLMVEHDTPLKGEIDWDWCVGTVRSGVANALRFHHEAVILPDHESLIVRDLLVKLPYALPAVSWWQRPHISTKEFYQNRILSYFPDHSRTFIEDKIYGKVMNAYTDYGTAGWWNWRIWIYDPHGNGEDMQRSYHTDGRAGRDKWDMWFE